MGLIINPSASGRYLPGGLTGTFRRSARPWQTPLPLKTPGRKTSWEDWGRLLADLRKVWEGVREGMGRGKEGEWEGVEEGFPPLPLDHPSGGLPGLPGAFLWGVGGLFIPCRG